MVVELEPVGDRPAGVLQCLKAMAVYALLLERADHPFDHAILLRAVRRDEFLPQAVAAHQRRIGPAREHQAIIAAQQKGLSFDYDVSRFSLGQYNQVDGQEPLGQRQLRLMHHGASRQRRLMATLT